MLAEILWKSLQKIYIDTIFVIYNWYVPIIEVRIDMYLIVSDIDETLLAHTHDNSVEVDNLATFIQSNNIALTFATGRSLNQMKDIIKQFEINYPLILNNGATIYYQGQFIFQASLSYHSIVDDLNALHQAGMAVMFSDDNQEYVDMQMIPDQGDPPKSTHRQPADFEQYIALRKDLRRIVFRDTCAENSKILDEYCNLLSNAPIEVIRMSSNEIELLPKGINKFSGIQELRKLFPDIQRVMAIGNASNDIEMIQGSDVGVLVSNGHRIIEPFANYVTKASYASGIKEAIEKFVLVKK